MHEVRDGRRVAARGPVPRVDAQPDPPDRRREAEGRAGEDGSRPAGRDDADGLVPREEEALNVAPGPLGGGRGPRAAGGLEGPRAWRGEGVSTAPSGPAGPPGSCLSCTAEGRKERRTKDGKTALARDPSTPTQQDSDAHPGRRGKGRGADPDYDESFHPRLRAKFIIPCANRQRPETRFLHQYNLV